MPMTLMQIEREASKLSPQERDCLAGSLMSGCDMRAVEKAWIAEVESRDRALNSGRLSTISAEQAINAALEKIHSK